jgi:hypothetical protein
MHSQNVFPPGLTSGLRRSFLSFGVRVFWVELSDLIIDLGCYLFNSLDRSNVSNAKSGGMTSKPNFSWDDCPDTA